MKNTICLSAFTLAAVLVVLPETAAMAATKVFLLGGQSNMGGVGGYDAPLPAVYNTPPPNVKFWNYGTPQPVDSGIKGNFVQPWVGDAWVDLTGGFGHQLSYFGPEVTFGRTLHELYPNDQIYLIKEGISATSLAVDWKPDGTGPIYNRFKERVNAALQNLRTADLQPEIVGMIWMQGEQDAGNAAWANNYKANLTNFIGSVRNDFNAPSMKFVIGRILPYFDTSPAGGNAIVRDAQQTIQNQPGMTGVSWINTDDLQCAYGGHYGTQGQLDLGTRFANEYIPVPEPSAIIMTGTALLAVAGYWWRMHIMSFCCGNEFASIWRDRA